MGGEESPQQLCMLDSLFQDGKEAPPPAKTELLRSAHKPDASRTDVIFLLPIS